MIENEQNLNEDNPFEVEDQLIRIKDQIEAETLENDYVKLDDEFSL